MEQEDENLFNRAKLINIGAKIAHLNWQAKCSFADEVNLCVVSHDIDMLPLNPELHYTCKESPKLLATAAEQFNYDMPYQEYFGGWRNLGNLATFFRYLGNGPWYNLKSSSLHLLSS